MGSEFKESSRKQKLLVFITLILFYPLGLLLLIFWLKTDNFNKMLLGFVSLGLIFYLFTTIMFATIFLNSKEFREGMKGNIKCRADYSPVNYEKYFECLEKEGLTTN